MNHFADPWFWALYEKMPPTVRTAADKNFELLKHNPSHPSLHFKKVGRYRSVRAGIKYRALAVEAARDLLWFWIGNHKDYETLLKNLNTGIQT